MKHRHLGAIPYEEALAVQRILWSERLAGRGEDTLLTAEHRPGVLTAGRRARVENLLLDEAGLERAGVRCFAVERGGDWTWHGPGQLVAYPIVRLAGWGLDVPRFVAGLEVAMGAVAGGALAGVEVGRLGCRPGYPGLWIEGPRGLEKLGAVGVHVRRFVSMHGLALNLDPDPWGFAYIRPCGLTEPVTSLRRLLGPAGAVPTTIEASAQLAEALPRAWRGELPPIPELGSRASGRSGSKATVRRASGG